MNEILRAAPLYTFLWYCNQSPLPKNVLDCGAGGARPPLALFHQYGYQTHGLEISSERRQMARRYEEERGIALNIQAGDMRHIPFPDRSLSFVYSFNTIFHLSRADITRAIAEMHRVLHPDGLCFLNFLSVDDEEYGKGAEVEPGSFRQSEDDRPTLHTYFGDDEGDAFFSGFELQRKEKRIVDLWDEGQKYRMAFLDYYGRKAA